MLAADQLVGPRAQSVLHWAPVPPMTALSLFLDKYHGHPLVLTYAVRVLHSFPPENILFYTPQVVQTLRFDKQGPARARARPPR